MIPKTMFLLEHTLLEEIQKEIILPQDVMIIDATTTGVMIVRLGTRLLSHSILHNMGVQRIFNILQLGLEVREIQNEAPKDYRRWIDHEKCNCRSQPRHRLDWQMLTMVA